VESGYLLLQKDAATGLYEHTHTLDAAGNEAFVKLLKATESKFVREVTLSVTAMTEKLTTISNVAWTDTLAALPSAATTVAMTTAGADMVTGYLIDEWCWNTNEKIALDTGAKLDEDPGAHTI
jgi:hypothetical protein